MRLSVLLSFLLAAGAPAVYGQKKDVLEQMQLDVITLQQQTKQLQSSLDTSSGTIKGLVEKITDQVAAGFQKTDESVEDSRKQNEAATRDLHTIATTLTTLSGTVSDLQEALTAVNAQVKSLSQQVLKATTTSQPLPGPNDVWRSAQLDYLTGNYDLAIPEYQDFLSQYSSDPRAAQAHLRIGESLLNLKKYVPAETEFDLVVEKYSDSDSDSARAALLKKGYSLAEHDKPQAIKVLNGVVKQFRNTTEAASAQEKLRVLSPPPPPLHRSNR